jgi:hypothetical protein
MMAVPTHSKAPGKNLSIWNRNRKYHPAGEYSCYQPVCFGSFATPMNVANPTNKMNSNNRPSGLCIFRLAKTSRLFLFLTCNARDIGAFALHS